MLVGGFIGLIVEPESTGEALFALLIGGAIVMMRAWEHNAVARQRAARKQDLRRRERNDGS